MTEALVLRHVGAYSDLVLTPFLPGDPHWSALLAFAETAKLACEPLAYGVYYDDPNMTPAPAQRSDLGVPVRAPVPTHDRFRGMELAGGDHAMIEHLGPPHTISQAYRNLADGVRRAAHRYGFSEAPPFQIFREVHVGGDAGLYRTEIYFPLVRRG